MNIGHPFRRSAGKQRGIVLVLIVVGMTSVLGIAGLALDFGLAFLTKSRIQNALDAAALAGAKVLKTTGSTAQAEADAQTAFNFYLGQLNRESLTPTFEFSSTVAPAFNPGTTPSNYIRVRMPEGYTIPTYLTQIFPGASDTLALRGSAVAGPIRTAPAGQACDLTPIVVQALNTDTDCSDGSCYGYTIGDLVPLKAADETVTAGPGNFNLLDLKCPTGKQQGAACVRQGLAGGGGGCATVGGTVETQTGAESGPFEQGINTRFGDYKGGQVRDPELYPPDVVTDEFPEPVGGVSPFNQYQNALANKANWDFPPPVGVPRRRVIAVVMSTFANAKPGTTPIPVTGIGCFFLRTPPTGSGKTQQIPAEFTLDCAPNTGVRSNLPLDNDGQFFKIVLYKDPDSRES